MILVKYRALPTLAGQHESSLAIAVWLVEEMMELPDFLCSCIIRWGGNEFNQCTQDAQVTFICTAQYYPSVHWSITKATH